MTQRPPPRFYGIKTFQDSGGIYKFQYPSTWTVFQLADERDGVMISPDREPPANWVSAWKTDLGESVVAEDLPDLRAGLDEGLARLGEQFTVEAAREEVMGNLIKLERIHSFEQDGQRRRRRQWVLYVDHWQIVLMYQGASLEEYDYWLAMANYSFYTFDLPTQLWFAADRDLSGLATRSR